LDYLILVEHFWFTQHRHLKGLRFNGSQGPPHFVLEAFGYSKKIYDEPVPVGLVVFEVVEELDDLFVCDIDRVVFG